MPQPLSTDLRSAAMAIWKAGVDAVDAARLVREHMDADSTGLTICGKRWTPTANGRICVVGAGKAGRGMVAGAIEALGPTWMQRTTGWVNIPDDGKPVDTTAPVRLHKARPAGINEPRPEGVTGTREILDRVAACGSDDLCLVLISGGGSALLPAPHPDITLEDKSQITRQLSRAGATIQELNCVRRELSLVKGGGLLRACRASRLITLIISDVIGDPLEVIASGPTIPAPSNRQGAWDIVSRLVSADAIPDRVRQLLRQSPPPVNEGGSVSTIQVSNHIIGNNQTAVDAAVRQAQQQGFEVIRASADEPGIAREVGHQLAQDCLQWRHRHSDRTRCIISGGEPIVHVVATTHPQKGGRNQELALAAAQDWFTDGGAGMILLSGGSDGEDGPTDAAGAFVDAGVIRQAQRLGLRPLDFLQWNNAYPFFEQTGGLLKTGPTGTNVMDLRVALVAPDPLQGSSV